MTQQRSSVRAFARWLVILLIITLTGCAYGRTMRAGDKAFEAGDYEAALAQYEGALKVNPNSEEAAAKLAKTREMLVARDIEAARAALGAGDLLGAMAAANGAWVQLPDSEATASIVRDVSNAVYARAQKLTDERDWANALMLLQALPESLPSEAERAKPMADGVLNSWVDQLRTGAEAAVAAGRKGDATLQYAKLTQLTGDATYGGKRDELRRQVLDEHRYVVKVGARRSEGAQIVLDAVTALGSGTALLVSPKPAKGQVVDATASFTVSKPRYRTEETSRNEVATYQSGTRQVENPFYRSKQEEVVREENRLLEYENEVTKLQSDVDRYRSDVAREGDTPNVSTGAEQNLYNAENRLESARNKVEDQRRTVMRVREDFADEAPYTEEAVFTDAQYPVKTTTLIAETTLVVKIEHEDDREAIELKVPLTTQASDDSNAALAVAGVAADPLALPSRSELAGQLYQQASAQASGAVTQSFDAWRETLVARALAAGTDDERVDLLAIYLITDPTRVKASVPADIAAFRGIPDAVKILRP